MAPARMRGTRVRGEVSCFPLSRPVRSALFHRTVRIDFSWVRGAMNRFVFEAAVAKVHINADWPLYRRAISADG